MSTEQIPDSGADSGARERASGSPSFGTLLAANLKVVGWALVLCVVCYGTWRGLRALFPEIAWLRAS